MLRTKTARLGFVASSFAISMALLSAAAIGAPAVQQVSGTLAHKTSVTITGSGFGTKPTAAPLVWDDASGSSVLAKWSAARPSIGNSAYYLNYRSAQRSVPMPHGHVSKYLAGSHAENLGAEGGAQVMLFKTITVPSYPLTFYVSWYQTVDPAWVFGGDNNFKTFRLSDGSGDSPYGNGWYTEYNNSTFTNATTTDGLVNHMNDSTGTIQIPDMNGHGAWWGGMVNPIAAGWVKQEMTVRISSGNDGYIKQWENGRMLADYLGPTDKFGGTPPYTRTIGIGGYARNYNQPNNWRYFADVYVDTTLSRVVLANSPVLADATVRENQIPSSWSSTSISVTVNLGRFSEGQGAYLFVVDSSGASNAGGYPVTIGASTVGASDTRPNAPSSVVVQ